MTKLAFTLALVLFSSFGITSFASRVKQIITIPRKEGYEGITSLRTVDNEIIDPFVEQTCFSTSSDAKNATLRFSDILKFRTVSSRTAQNHVVEPEEFEALHNWMPKTYPEVWDTMTVERIGSGSFSLLLRWPSNAASSSSSQLPVLFISHLDVVPVPDAAKWKYGPFSGNVTEGFIWGRGSLDVKVGVSGLLEAATLLIKKGWKPNRTLYFAFGHDEEVGGGLGAAETAKVLKERGVQFDMLYDEGGAIDVDGFSPYTTRPIALVGAAEKGFATVQINITTIGGHSSAPPLDGSSAAAIAARIVTSIDRNPPSVALRPPATTFLSVLAKSMPLGLQRLLFEAAGSGADGPEVGQLVANMYLAKDAPDTAALVRTTAAVTGLSSGISDNVLPPTASVLVNFRLLPGFSESDLWEYLNQTLGSDMQYVQDMTLVGGVGLATNVTPADSPYMDMLRSAIQEVYVMKDGNSTVDVAPTLMLGGTDSKHYLHLSRGHALRHVPVSGSKTAGDMARVHGLNERVREADFWRAVCVYRRLLELVGGGKGPGKAEEDA